MIAHLQERSIAYQKKDRIRIFNHHPAGSGFDRQHLSRRTGQSADTAFQHPCG